MISSSRAAMRDIAGAATLYAIVAIALTWPLARGLARDIPGDFGDPLLNAWIVAWGADHLWRALNGHVWALGGYWNANIFYPHPLALAYSEHLTAQAIQILPVYAAGGNPILCYNLLFLSTFVLSAVGMFLLMRELTGRRSAALVAGLAFGFAPYRFGSIPHLQVLSSAWMPFTILGFRRFFTTGRARPLVGGAAAWVAQNWSCGYYLLFFSPVVVMYLVWEIVVRRLWQDRSRFVKVVAAVVAVAAITLPFVIPYVELRRLGFAPRSLRETEHYSADVFAYFTADPNLRLWGPFLQAWPHAENALFPGATILVLAVVGSLAAWREARRNSAAVNVSRLSQLLGALLTVAMILVVTLLLGWSIRSTVVKVTSVYRVLAIEVALAIALLGTSARARMTARYWWASPVAILTFLTLFAVVMSFGPFIHARGRLVADPNLYRLLFDYAPGFDGLRVPARFGMIVAFGLAALAGYGAAAVVRRRGGRAALLAAAALVITESYGAPLTLNNNSTAYQQPDLAPLPASVAVGASTPAVYRFAAASLPASAVILELPFGDSSFDVQYMFYSTQHWRRLVNGYSGGAPIDYGLVTGRLVDFRTRPDRAWQTLFDSGATYCIVHGSAFINGRGQAIEEWLSRHGARRIESFDGDSVYEIRHSF